MIERIFGAVHEKTNDSDLARKVCLLSLRGQLELLNRLSPAIDTNIEDLIFDINIKINYYTKI